MKKKTTFICLILVFMLVGCADETSFSEDESVNSNIIENQTKGAYNDGYFPWDLITVIETEDNRGAKIKLPLPWTPGGANAIGVPSDWIDPNAEIAYDERYYSRKNGWVMLYSNMNRSAELNKYFALYNTNTGILRFFVFSIAASSGAGTSSTFFGININKSSSLFNFTNSLAEGMAQRKSAPAYIYSPGWTIGDTSRGIGFKENQWYGFEIECAYDSNVQENSAFNVNIWAANVSKITGVAKTQGEINGSIKSVAPNMPNLNLTLNNTNNSNNSVSANSSITLNNTSAETEISTVIDEGTKKGDPFFTKLWKDVSGNLSKWIGAGVSGGVKDGVKAAFTSGGSVVTKVLGSVLNSVIGGGNKENISKVELELSATTNIQAESVQEVVGWGGIKLFPLPGSKSKDAPFYDKPLGIWNLKETPIIYCDLISTITHPYDLGNRGSSEYWYYYELKSPEIILNPEVLLNYQLKDFNTRVVVKEDLGSGYKTYMQNAAPYALINSEKYCSIGNSGTTQARRSGGEIDNFELHYDNEVFLVHVFFDLEHKVTKETYSFSKYFTISKIEKRNAKVRHVINPQKPSGGGSGGGKPGRPTDPIS